MNLALRGFVGVGLEDEDIAIINIPVGRNCIDSNNVNQLN